MSRRDYPTLEENIQFIINDLGWEKILQNTDPEDVDPGLVINWRLDRKDLSRIDREAIEALIQKFSAEGSNS